MRLKPHEWVLLRVCAAAAGGAALFAAADWLGGVVGLVIGWRATGLDRTARVERRASQFAEQLPDALQLVIGSHDPAQQ